MTGLNSLIIHLCRMYGFNWTNISARTAIGTFIRVNFVDVSFGDCFNRALIDAGSASSAVICDYVSHCRSILN